MKRFLSFLITLALLLSFSCVSFAENGIPGLELKVNASAYGLDDLDELIKDMGFTVQLGFDEDDTLLLDGVLQLSKDQSYRLILTADENEVGFQIPELDGKYYCFDLKEFAGELTKYASEKGVPVPADGKINPAELISPKEVIKTMKFFEKYGEILSGIVTEENVTTETAQYSLEGIGAEVTCELMRFAPKKDDWSAMLDELIRSLQTDKQFREFLTMALSAAPETSRPESADETLDVFYSILDELLKETDNIAEYLSGYTVTVASDDTRVYAVRLDGSDLSIGYESYGDLAGTRFDVLAKYGEEPELLAANAIQFSDADGLVEDLFYIPSLEASLSLLFNPETSELSVTVEAPDFMANFSHTLIEDGNKLSATVDAEDFHGELLLTSESRDDKELFSAVLTAGDFVGNLDLTVEPDSITAALNAGDFSAELLITSEYKDGKNLITVKLDSEDCGGELDISAEEKELALSEPDGEKVVLHELSELEEVLTGMFG